MAFRSGIVAMLGKPNVGKSTLVNALVGQRVSIVSNKPQTTRRRALGVDRGDDYEIVFIDTPGIHEPHTRLGRQMVEEARMALSDVDLVLFVADASHMPDAVDQQIAKLVVGFLPVVVCLNKMDRLHAEHVIKHVEAYTKLLDTDTYMMTTATRGDNLEELRKMLIERLPEHEPRFSEDEFTDQSQRFMASEFIRERVLVATRQEVPHATAVVIEEWNETDTRVEILAEIFVERSGQRAILIGAKGAFVKQVGSEARAAIEDLVGKPVFLELVVKVRENWRMNPSVLQELQEANG